LDLRKKGFHPSLAHSARTIGQCLSKIAHLPIKSVVGAFGVRWIEQGVEAASPQHAGIAR
jgi:hypothetical protein